MTTTRIRFGLAALAAETPLGSGPTLRWPNSDAVEQTPPQILRRRVSPVGQAALRAAWALPHRDTARYVFASRHGEHDRTLAMLDAQMAGDGPSPADFSLGVHNALAGLLSLAAGNRAGHTALAAGVDSFACGLIEAACSLAEPPHEPVILVYFDAALPGFYPHTPPAAEAPLALAMTLVASHDAPLRIEMAIEPRHPAAPEGAAAPAFLRFIRTGTPVSADGARHRWTWRHG